MTIWESYRRLPRAWRIAVPLALLLPLVVWYGGDVRDGLVMWLIIATVAVIPPLVTRRIFRPVDGVDPEDPRHPRHTSAFLLGIAIAVAAAALIVAVDRALTP